MPGDVQPVDSSSMQTFSNDKISVVGERLIMILKFTAHQADHISVSMVHGSQFIFCQSVLTLVVQNVHSVDKPLFGNFCFENSVFIK